RHGHAHLAVGAETGVKVVDVPELDHVVLEVEALRQDAPKGGLVAAVEEGRPPRVGVGQWDDVVVDEWVRDALRDDVALVPVKGKRRRVTGVDPRNARDVQLRHLLAPPWNDVNRGGDDPCDGSSLAADVHDLIRLTRRGRWASGSGAAGRSGTAWPRPPRSRPGCRSRSRGPRRPG